MRISDWSSDVCSSDLHVQRRCQSRQGGLRHAHARLSAARHIALALSVGRRLPMHQWRLGSGKMPGHRIYSASVARVYPFYIAKAEKKGRTKGAVDEIISWLTGPSKETLEQETASQTYFKDSFSQ